MFKIESYITPILLSYVDKYIKNFRPEDSQVSLWGGDVSFHSLDLRLEVLEQELQLPFSFISGRIHELLIHVPWTKLASEPITITINTIECILKLRGEDSVAASDSASHASAATSTARDSRRKGNKRQDVVAPPGYVQSLVNKIVSNITIICSNLILKYVEEDIVLSVNVKTVTLQSANESWQPAFTDISPTQIMLRKLINLADVTICLDKRNASGKIEMYQEPLLYRCSMELHLLRSYHTATAKQVSVTRVDIRCENMNFSLTEQQVPMLMRLALLGIALHGKELRPEQSQSVEHDSDVMQDSVPMTLSDSANESWAGWAWSWVPSLLPISWNEDWSAEQHHAYAGQTYHIGFYVRQASVTFKVKDSAPDWSYYGPRKVKFNPFLVIHLQGCFLDFVMHGAGWLNVQTGMSQVIVEPHGNCFCGVKEATTSACPEGKRMNQKEFVYLAAGNQQNNYMVDSLFDPVAVENKGKKKTYNVSWEDHLSTVTEALLLEKSPAIAMDYLYMLELPDDFNSERLSELGSDLEYSNLSEKALCRVVVGPTAVKICSGLFHRIQMIRHVARLYDYSPYSTPKPEPTREQLPPPSAEDFESLENNIPKRVFQVTLFKPVINIHLADHPVFDPPVFQAPRKYRETKPLLKQMTHLPKVTLECQCLDARIVRPMYPRRLIITTCQLPAPPQHMFHACHFHMNVKVLGLSSHLVLNPGGHTTVLMPSNLAYTQQNLLLTHYWDNCDIPHTNQTLRAETLTVICTKAKLMVISSIIQSQFDPTSAVDIMQNSSLLADAAKHTGMEYLELCMEELSYQKVITPGTKAFNLSLGALKAFVLEFPLKQDAAMQHGHMVGEPQQALVLFGPEDSTSLEDVDTNQTVQQPLFCLMMQCTRDPTIQDHPPVLMFNVREVRACVDPMMWRWLHYAPGCNTRKSDKCGLDTSTSSSSGMMHRRSRRVSSEASGGFGIENCPARRAPTPQESVHSSSDREQVVAQIGPSLSPVAHSRGAQSGSAKQASTSSVSEQAAKWTRDNILLWFPVWRGMVLCGDVAQCVVYLPTASLSAVGTQSIEEALAQCQHSKTSPPPEVLVMIFPLMTFRSAAQKKGLYQYMSQLPVKLPENVWTKDRVSFPWSLSMADLSCYTLQNGTKLNFLKPVSVNATIGISAKCQNDKVVLGAIGLCVHVDVTPVNISVCQEQMRLMASVLVRLLEFSSLQFFSFSSSDTKSAAALDPPTAVSPTVFPESSGSRESPPTPLSTDSSEDQSSLSESSDVVKITVWMQSTLARLTVSLYAVNSGTSRDELKLTVDMEDIMTSLDLQPVYMKVKSKVAYASILHYVRKPHSTSWDFGPYVGLVMRRQEDLASSQPHAVHRDVDDGSGFFSVTFTRAKCHSVHSRWGTWNQTVLLADARSSDSNAGLQDYISTAHYISEIVVKLQPVDLVFSALTLSSFVTVLYPVLMLSEHKQIYTQKTTGTTTNWAEHINSNTLPLLYLDTCNIRIILPASELTAVGDMHDVCLLQVEAVSLTPQADNPLGRTVFRSNFYRAAEQAHILCVPGSEVEDRQYQLDIKGFTVNTGTWQDLDCCLSLTNFQSSNLRTMSENPAVEWNNLASGKENFTPHMSLVPVIARLNLCVVAAPAIVCRGDLVCGHSLEVNAVTDIEVLINTGQLRLASALLQEILLLLKPLLVDLPNKKHSPGVQPTSLMKTVSEGTLEMDIAVTSCSRFVDSGVDCADASSASVVGREARFAAKESNCFKKTRNEGEFNVSHPSTHHRQRSSESPATEVTSKRALSQKSDAIRSKTEHPLLQRAVPVEILLTAGKVSLALYELVEKDNREVHLFSSRLKQKLGSRHVHNKFDLSEDVGYEAGSEEGSVEDVPPPRKYIQPLLYMLMAQPHAFLSIFSFRSKVQISCFDISIRSSEQDYIIPRGVPHAEDFLSVLLETKGGDPHPDTGIPPAFLTVRWCKTFSKASKIDVELGRPTKIYYSIAQWCFIDTMLKKVQHCLHDFLSSPHSKETTLKTQPGVDMQNEDSSQNITHHDIRDPDSVTNVELPSKKSLESERVPHLERNRGSDWNYQNQPCDPAAVENKKQELAFKDKIGGVGSISISSQQLVFQLSGLKHESEIVASVAGVTGTMSRNVRGQMDRVVGNMAVNCLMLTTALEGLSRRLLNPWSFSVDVCLAWEPWLPGDSPPQVQLTVDSDCILVDVGPEHLRCLRWIWSEYEPFLNSCRSDHVTELDSVPHFPDQDQHYRDDLRAGAFQFVDASSELFREDLPLPYQVVFLQAPPTMAWRYPQPRVLTRVDIFPVPFKVATDHLGQECKSQVLCSLQYWSDCHARYLPYTQFQLSESEMCCLELPAGPHQVVSCTWRVQLSVQSGEEDEQHDAGSVLVSSRALAACMRVDSFFAAHLVPSVQAALNISSVQVALYNHMTSSSASKPLPLSLKQFSVDQLTPDSQCFMFFTLDSASLYVCMWSSGKSSMIELSSHVRCDIIDYAYLTQQCAIEPFQAKVQLTVGDTTAVSCVTKPIAVRFGPAIGHTLAVSAQLWAQAYHSCEGEGETPASSDEFQVIVTRYVICNDTTRPLRFGQALTDEDILLGSRQCHFYAWHSHRVKQVLRVGIEEGAWLWSKPFSIDVDGVQFCGLADCGTQDISFVVKVSSLSATQKQVTLSGQLVLTNLLAEHLGCRILPAADETSGPEGEGQNLIAMGRSTPPSVLFNTNCKMILRIKFYGLDSMWSGDIPLRENCRSGQPWLVKVPLHERGQFLSVWCRVIYQHLGQGVKVLAMLCPLFMIRSYLPVPAKVLIDTPGLKVHLEATINGRGEEQQLYCPGTVDHSHKLTFKLDNGTPPSNSYVPLSYAVIDQRTFFKMDSKDIDIDAIVSSLNEVKTSIWPFAGEEYANVEWVAAEQPETHIQVKYVPQGLSCSTLLVELQPWALLVNVLGCPIVIMVEDSVICRVPHQGVIAPPKLEHTFSLGLDFGEIVHMSPPLQLARLDFGNGFYMPRISGLIPTSGSMQTIIQCGKNVAFLSIASLIVKEMRVLTVRAKYIICNRTSLSLQVMALAVREFERHSCSIKEEEQSFGQTVLPHTEEKSNCGCPIVQWAVPEKEGGEGDLLPYIMLNTGAGWSCPLRINDGVIRRCFSIPVTVGSDGLCNSAYVLTVQEHSGQIFLSVYPDIHPQITLHNMCRFKILCAQGIPDDDGKAVQETANFDWWCSIGPRSCAHYTLPATSQRFPDIVSSGNWPPLVLALSDSCSSRNSATLLWSRGINITETQEQFVRLAGHGDIKVQVKIQCYTTHVVVETVSHVEISARDIRSRLLHHQEDTEPATLVPLFHHATLSHSATSYASECLPAQHSSYSESEHKIKTGSDTSSINEDDKEGSDFLDHGKLQVSESSGSLPSNLPATAECQSNGVGGMLAPSKTKHIHAALFLRGVYITLTEDIPKKKSERTQIVLLCLDNVCVSVKPLCLREGSEELAVCVRIGDLQLDNQMFQHGGFDFPVILIGQVPKCNLGHGFSLSMSASHLMEQFSSDALIVITASLETLSNRRCSCTIMKQLKVSFGPLRAYIEDTLITKLIDYLMCLLPTSLILLPPSGSVAILPPRASLIPLPKITCWDSQQIAFPLRLHMLTLQPLSLLLSVHTSLKLYIALDHSPLHFSAYERQALITTPYRLGHALTMHYLSGAIFGAGWMVSSLELLGSPGGFARTLGSGLRDFVSLPYRGIFDGPWGFLVGVTHGSASLMKHVTAGTVSSVTKLAASVARNLDRLTLDQEHLARTEELRRQRPQGVTHGLVQGLTGLGISLLGAVGGIAHHPLQSVMNEGASTRGVVKGVGLGLVGAITKPLSGAAELVALTGQGLLHGAGWTSLPEVRQQSIIEHTFSGANSRLKYGWKLIAGLGADHHTLLHVTEATSTNASSSSVALVLTTWALFLVDTEQDTTTRVISLAELSGVEYPSVPTLLCFRFQPAGELEATSLARVLDFVRNSSGMVADTAHDDAQSEVESLLTGSPLLSEPPDSTDTPLMFNVNQQSRNYFLSLLALAKRQSEGRGFSVL